MVVRCSFYLQIYNPQVEPAFLEFIETREDEFSLRDNSDTPFRRFKRDYESRILYSVKELNSFKKYLLRRSERWK